MDLKNVSEILQRPSAGKSKKISHFSFDSREVVKGGLFFALPGAKVDGHQFLQEAARRGAAAAVVSESYFGQDFGMSLIRVPNVLDALHLLAKEKMANTKAKIIGITGSIGKTTTKEFIAGILSEKYRVYKTPHSYNTQISFPTSLLNAEAGYEYFVLEMGMSGKGHIKKLISIAPPHIAVLTRISHSHLEFFSSVEEISQVKAEIFLSRQLEQKIISCQTESFPPVRNTGNASTIVYGKDIFYQKKGKEIRLCSQGESSPWFAVPFEASHFLENFLGAAAVGLALGLTWKDIIGPVKHLPMPKMRFEKVFSQNILFINDSYNANVDSTRAALQNLPSPAAGKKTLLVFADMKELGGYTKKAHQEIAIAAIKKVDGCLCLGEESKYIADYFQKHQKLGLHFDNKLSLQHHLMKIAEEGDVVLLKGANSYRLWEIIP